MGMSDISIIGIGQVPVAEHWDKSLRELAGDAIFAAISDASYDQFDAIFIGNMLSGISGGQENLGALIADWIGRPGLPALKIEAACGSGGAALRAAIAEIRTGEIETAIVVGVEKMSETRGVETTAALATAADADYEVAYGLSFVAINAFIMKKYMYEYGWGHSDFAQFSINAHNNAVHNKNARLRSMINERDYQRARMISSPINLLDASPTGDGAAAIIISSSDYLQTSTKNRINIVGCSFATDTLSVHDRPDPLWLSAAEKSAIDAYRQSGITPKDIDFFELHDAFSIMAALSLEACGFAEKGKGLQLAIDGEIVHSGKIPIATLGGLKARGHPVGATGLYQIVEACIQLRGEAGDNQIDGAKLGMAQNIGGSGASVITHILSAN